MNVVFDAAASLLLFAGGAAGFLGGWLIGFEKGKYEGFIAGRRSKGLVSEGK